MTGQSLIAKRYIVRGRVQGVGFRWYVEREAKQLGMAGWVRNNEDSSVELVAAGSTEQHEALRGKLEAGPRGSRVDRVDESEVEPGELSGKLKAFTIEGAW
jgi:acylphosphatase